MNIYVGNLAYTCSEDDLKDLFGEYGEVTSARIINDRETGRSKGFGFVEMEDDPAKKAIDALNNYEHQGRNLKVNEARPRNERPQRNSWR